VIIAPEHPIFLFGDPSRIEQVVTNLLTNAAKYTPADGKVTVELSVEGDQAVIRVADNGIGIPENMFSHIFEMFRQQPQHRGQGLGIGLALAKTLVEMHGGTIQVHSDGPGKGTTFTCRLPLSESRQPAVALPTYPFEKRTSPAERFRIVVIDDQVDALHELCLLLKLFGHEVYAAHSGQDGIDQANRVQPQVVLLDIRMPDMDGFEVVRRLRANPQFEQTLIVAMTGKAGDSTEEQFRAAAFDHVLLKPVAFETVQELLATRERAPTQPWN
jgi:CheY-like chemotaxis protein/anti-sigma regulatory factor (Ser/Thr protein kinase)